MCVIEVRDEREPAGRHGDGVDADRVAWLAASGAAFLERISPKWLSWDALARISAHEHDRSVQA